MVNTIRDTNYYLQTLAVLILLCLSQRIQAQDVLFSFNQITVKEGLTSQTNNYYIFHDSNDFIWISSTNGVNRFDGTTITNDLENKNIQSRFFEDNEGKIWFSSYDAIYHYEGKSNTFTPLQIHDKDSVLITSNYQLLHYDTSSNDFWIRIRNKPELYKYNIGTGHCSHLTVHIASSNAQISESNNNEERFLVDPLIKGIRYAILSDTPRDTILFQDYFMPSYYLENDTNLWIGSDSTLIQYDLKNSRIKFIKQYPSRLIPSVNGIFDPGDGRLIISTPENGLYYLNKKNGDILHAIYSYEDGKAHLIKPVFRMHLDADKNLWISSNGKGILFTNLNKGKIKRRLLNYNGKKDRDNHVKSITEDSKGNLYCLTENNVEIINLYNGSKRQLERPDSLPLNFKSFHIFCDKRNDNIWYATIMGLFVSIRGEEAFKKVSSKASLYIYQTPDSTLLVSSYGSGIFQINSENGLFSLEKHFNLTDTLGGYTLTFCDSKNRLFLSKGQNSILIYQYADEQLIPLDTILFDGFVHGLVEDKKRDKLWLASDQGLYEIQAIRQDSFSFQKDNIFPINVANGLLMDDQHYLWVSTNKGLFHYFPHHHADSIQLKQYTIEDGLQSLDFSFWSALKTSTGELTFGGVNGLNIFDPYKIDSLNIEANPTITHIEINNKAFPDYLVDSETGATNVSHLEKLVLEHNQNDLYLKIAALEYSAPSSNQYVFKMINQNSGDTIENRKDNTFQYPNMQPGAYLLKYNASNSDGIWFDKTEKQLAITIKPPWWKTIWAYLFYFLSAAGIIYAYSRYRISLIQKEEAFKREVAEYKQLAAETETAILRLQMNPHFIFNSMNSISSYIDKQDIRTANNYLNRFAKLMRMVLKFSAKPFIVVSDEIDLLEQYLQTESMRFEKKFTYEFKLEDEFDSDEYRIPTMILQPFVENAIWHGLSNKEGQGKILVRFWEAEDSLFCSIEDNGIGREAAGQLKKQSSEYESKALSITNKRFDLLEAKDGRKASFEIQDIEDDKKNIKGTRVLLKFPFF